MKTAPEWIKKFGDPGRGFATLDYADVAMIQLDAKQDAADQIVGHLRRYWGYEIVRTIARQIAKAYSLPEPAEPFHPERLHPGAKTAEVPPKVDQVLFPDLGVRQVVTGSAAEKFGLDPDAVWQVDATRQVSQSSSLPNLKTSSLPPSPKPSPPHPVAESRPYEDPPVPGVACCSEEPAVHLKPVDPLKVTAADLAASSPKAPEPPSAELMTVKERLDFHSEFLVTLEERLKKIEKYLALDAKPPALARIEYSERRLDAWHAQLRDLEASQVATASELRERLEALEKQNQARAEHLAKTGEYLHHAYLRIEALEALGATFRLRPDR